jgi:hypothetical protein
MVMCSCRQAQGTGTKLINAAGTTPCHSLNHPSILSSAANGLQGTTSRKAAMTTLQVAKSCRALPCAALLPLGLMTSNKGCAVFGLDRHQ